MSRSGEITFKGHPMTLVGEKLAAGQAAPDFVLHYFQDGMQTLTLADLSGKPALISVVPSLDTGVCAIQTKQFNERLAALGESIHAVTVSCDLPFAQGRFCGDNDIANMKTASDYQNRNFGNNWGMLIEELLLHARGVFVLDGEGKIVYAETVGEVTNEPNYDAAMEAINGLLASA